MRPFLSYDKCSGLQCGNAAAERDPEHNMKYLQRLGKALMLPVAVLPVCALLMGIGYLLCPAAMQGGTVSGTAEMAGLFLVKAGSAAIDNIALLFVIGVGAGMSKDNDGTGAIAALISWLMITTLLKTDFVTTLMPSVSDDPRRILAFDKIANPFIGIISGLIGSQRYNRFREIRLPDWLAFFSGKRFVAIAAAFISVGIAAVLLFVWPVVFSGLAALGNGIAGMGAFGAAIYAFLNRLLIPTGLHHALNNVFWFDTIGLGDLTHFWAGHTSADVDWSLGMYMSGFFPCMMFGVPGAALAVIRCADPNQRKKVAGLLLSSALCSFVCGVTEPFEFSFMFLAPGLYLVYSILYGIFTYITCITGFRAGFSFSGGAVDLLFSASLPAAAKTLLILPLGAAVFAVFYCTFRFAITKWNLKTPGRGSDEDLPAEKKPQKGVGFTDMAEALIAGLGGYENLVSVEHCATRLRLEVKDSAKVDDSAIRRAGALGLFKSGKNGVQVIIGTKVQFVADEMTRLVQERD